MSYIHVFIGFEILDAKIIRGKNSTLSLNYGFVLMKNIGQNYAH